MAPKRRPITFRLRDVARVLRAYRSAGEPTPTVRITPAGDILAIPNSRQEEPPAAADPWNAEVERIAKQ